MSDVLLVAARAQRKASDPRASVWVMASAGTGKTKVLTDRVLRLLLDGTHPSRLLCLTFTKAAAAEMSDRLSKRLLNWAIVDEAGLEKSLFDLLDEAPGPDTLLRARRLFAQVLDAPDGLRIETIHGFCQLLLRRFPLEAGVAPHFQVLDDRDAQELMAEARNRVLSESQTDTALAQAMDLVSRRAQEEDFAKLLTDLASERGRIQQLIARHGDVAGMAAELERRFDLQPGATEDSVLASACRDSAFNASGLRQALPFLLAGSKTDIGRGGQMSAWLAATEDERIVGFESWCDAFLTKEGAPRAKLCTVAVENAMPGAGDILREEADRLVAAQDQIRKIRAVAGSAALLEIGVAIIDRYRKSKDARAALDYDDLILKTRTLLETEDRISWVMYKLDRGIDHLLVDEAQDTNPDQWAVIDALTADFFSGRGTREEGTRTIFAVGDSKQSIFGFQRADPLAFAEMRAHFGKSVIAVEGSWRPVELNISFRSTHAVLDAVDRVFAQPGARDGVAAGDQPIRHRSKRSGEAGRVEIWPLIEPAAAEDPIPWALPDRRVGADNPRGRLAGLIAARIRDMITRPDILESENRPVRAGDILVLVRRRGGFVEELVRELKQCGVPVAGADRMVLTEQMAVMDLMALAQALLLPEDDLTLAAVLKGPLIGLSEDELFELAWNRAGTLWAELTRRSEAPPFKAAYESLTGYRAMADLVPPHDLFTRILAQGGKTRLLARLGPDSEDPLDEFLALSLAYERLHAPSLQGFLRWIEQGGDVIKRDLDSSGGAVRIMTVHGAKGLEAPIVFLPDTVAVPQVVPRVLWAGPRGDEMPVWLPKAAEMDSVSLAAKQAAETARDQEYRRLLYVAMTRARDRLIVCGGRTAQQTTGSWYDLIRTALNGSPGVIETEDGLVLSSLQTEPPREAPPIASPGEARPLPGWARHAAPDEPVPARPLTPSRPDGAEPPVRSPIGGDDGARFRRGRLIHRLFQSLPELDPGRREEAAVRFLTRRGWGLSSQEQADIAAEVRAVLTHPNFAPLFGPGSRAEVPLAGLLGGRAITGQIDRLRVTDDAVQIVDFKSNRPPPLTVEGVADIYLRQMATYRGLLAKIYPARSITCMLLWTDGPNLMILPESLLNKAAAALGL